MEGVKRKRREPTGWSECKLCGNVEDLKIINGWLVCPPCRTCPHGDEVKSDDSYGCNDDDVFCETCALDYFSAHTFAGSILVRPREFLSEMLARGKEPGELLFHSWGEERESRAVLDELNNGTGNIGPAEPGEFPYPMYHHIRRFTA
jgi:hypothetical protein